MLGVLSKINNPPEHSSGGFKKENGQNPDSAHWAIRPRQTFATNLLTLLMTLSPQSLLPELPDILPILVCDTQ